MQKSVELREAQKAVLYNRRALDNEGLKLHMGMSTVIDVLDIKDRFKNALLAEVSAKQDYALAVLQLRHITGTLVGADTGGYIVTMERLTKIPVPEAP